MLLALSNLGDDVDKSKLAQIAKELIEDMIPFIKIDAKRKLDKMTKVLDEESRKVMRVEAPKSHFTKTRKLVPRVKRSKRKHR